MKIYKITVIFLLLIVQTSIVQGYTREKVIKRGFLQCGVSTGMPGFSTVDENGNWRGFDVDICRAVAVATLGDAEKVEFMPLAEKEAFTALLSGEVDILSRHTTWTYTRNSALGVQFAGISYYDGQGVMVAKKLGVEQLKDLKKVKICSPVNATSTDNLTDYLDRNKVEYKVVSFDSLDLAIKGFVGESCDVVSTQKSQLYSLKFELGDPETGMVLPEVITKEPLGPAVRQGDDTWFNIVKWSLYAMINGEELGVTSGNFGEMKISNRLDIKRFFGLEGSGGKGLGLKNDWAAEIIRQVGNYGEVFNRNLGPDSSMKIERGQNRLWNNGGLQYAPPFR